ncbi:MAG TPA: extracellular solute-binding protein [Chloroflexota bacterium]|nr:extracellular solute-binding protein [Chloroflexota bacterium]
MTRAAGDPERGGGPVAAARPEAPSLTRRGLLGTAPAAALALAACGGEPAAGGGGAAQPPPVQIAFFFPNWGQPAIYEAKEQRKIDAFQQQTAGVRVRAAPVPENYGPQLTSLFAAGTPPETFFADHQVVFAYTKQGFLDDLQPTAQKDRGFKKEDLHPTALDGLTVGGRLLGLTGWAFTNLYYYNADLFKQAGLPTPYELWQQDRWTWDAYQDAALKLHKREGARTVQAGTTLGLARLWMNAAGAQEFDNPKTPTRCLYDSEPAMEALQFRYDLQAKHRVHDPDFYKETGLNETTAFINGKSATMSRWTTGLADFKAITAFTWGMAPYPKKKGYASDYTHWAYGRAKGLADERTRDAAWQWLKFFTGAEGQKLEAQDMVGIPFTRAAQEVFARSVRQLPALEHPEAMGEILNKYPNSRLIAVDTPEIGRILNEELTPFWNGERGARAAGTAATQRVNEYLRTNPQSVS